MTLNVLSILLSSGALIALCIFCMHIGQYKEKVLNHEKILSRTLTPKIDGIHNLLIKVTTWLHHQHRMPADYIQRTSPFKLTSEGEQMLKESNLQNIIDNNIRYFIKQIEIKNPSTNYDKQQLCYEILLLEKDKEFMKLVKEYAFNKGNDLTSMLFAASIYLSNQILTKV